MPAWLCTIPVTINTMLPYSLTEAITIAYKDGQELRGLERDLDRKYRTVKINEALESILFYPCGNSGRQMSHISNWQS